MLTVITHTKNERPELLERCKKSVAAALPPGGEHLVIHCKDYETWVKRRVLDAKEHEIVAFVDDDDYISEDALSLCLEGMTKFGLGSACTDEVEVYPDGRQVRCASGLKTYYSSTIHPRVVHHVCVMRGDLIDVKAIDLHNRYGVGIDWFIRQSVIQEHGCVRIPIDGHFWTQHPGQHTQHTRALYAKHMREMQFAIRDTWPAKFSGALPILNVTPEKSVTI